MFLHTSCCFLSNTYNAVGAKKSFATYLCSYTHIFKEGFSCIYSKILLVM